MRSSSCAYGLAIQKLVPSLATAGGEDGAPGRGTTAVTPPYAVSITVTLTLGGPLTTAARAPTSETSAGVPPTGITATFDVSGSTSDTAASRRATTTLAAQTATATGRAPTLTPEVARLLLGSMRTSESACPTAAPPRSREKANRTAPARAAAAAAIGSQRRHTWVSGGAGTGIPAAAPCPSAAHAASTSAAQDSQRSSGALAIPFASAASRSAGSSGRRSLAFGGASSRCA